MIKIICTLLLLGISNPASSQLFKFGYKKEQTDELTISRNDRKKKLEIFVRDDKVLEEFVESENNIIENSESYISPSYVGKVVDPYNESEVYSSSFDENFVLLFVRRGSQRYFENGVSGASYFGLSSSTNRIIIDGSYSFEKISSAQVLEILQLTLNEEEWEELSNSSDVELHAFGMEGIQIGKLTKHYMRLITKEIDRCRKAWYKSN